MKSFFAALALPFILVGYVSCICPGGYTWGVSIPYIEPDSSFSSTFSPAVAWVHIRSSVYFKG